VLAVGPGLAGVIASGAEPPGASWLTGSAIEKQLATPVDVFWAGIPLRQAVIGLSHGQRVAVLIDRRVDPGQELEAKLNGTPLKRVLGGIAESRQLGLTWLGPVAYLGPSRATSRVRTLAELRREEIRSLPATVSRKFLVPERIRWDDFATPRDLLAQLAAESGIEISGLEQVPHDLWAGADLPPLSLTDRLTLIAGQFDLTFQIAADGSAVALVPVPDDVAITRSYPGGQEPRQLADQWAALVPESQIKIVAGKIHVRGLLEDHERITDQLRPPRRQEPTPTGPRPKVGRAEGEQQKRYTVPEGKGKGQLGPVLEQLAATLNLELKIDHEALERAGISLEQPVSFSTKDATLDELLEAVLKPAGCTFRREDNVIEIRPAQ